MIKLKLSCLVVFVFCFSVLNGFSYSIKVKVNGLKDSTCYLGHYFGQKQYTPVDTAKADGAGNIVFSKKKLLKEGVYLVIVPGTYFELIIGAEQDLKIDTDTGNYIYNMKTKGSLENEIFYNFQKVMIDKSKEAQLLVEKQQFVRMQLHLILRSLTRKPYP